MSRHRNVWIAGLIGLITLLGQAQGADKKLVVQTAVYIGGPHWETDYDVAYSRAKHEKKLLLIYFRSGPRVRTVSTGDEANAEDTVLGELSAAKFRRTLDDYVLLRLPLDASLERDGKRVTLLELSSFKELRGGPGLAIIDLAHTGEDYYEYLVSAVPFTPGKYYHFEREHVGVLLSLPPGTLTQRTMIFAVRIHPEQPASTDGEFNPVLVSEAAGHSAYQAQIHVQGHQDWDGRFHRILSRLLGRGRSTNWAPREVVAESWPDQNLVDSCVDCVASWRQSSGHWDAVKSQHIAYGYDIQRGSNGIWYATGIFSN